MQFAKWLHVWRLTSNSSNPQKNVDPTRPWYLSQPCINMLIKLHNNRFMPLKAASVVILDVYGRMVYEQTNFNSTLHTPDFSHEPERHVYGKGNTPRKNRNTEICGAALKYYLF
jgi:hypothetical protein